MGLIEHLEQWLGALLWTPIRLPLWMAAVMVAYLFALSMAYRIETTNGQRLVLAIKRAEAIVKLAEKFNHDNYELAQRAERAASAQEPEG